MSWARPLRTRYSVERGRTHYFGVSKPFIKLHCGKRRYTVSPGLAFETRDSSVAIGRESWRAAPHPESRESLAARLPPWWSTQRGAEARRSGGAEWRVLMQSQGRVGRNLDIRFLVTSFLLCTCVVLFLKERIAVASLRIALQSSPTSPSAVENRLTPPPVLEAKKCHRVPFDITTGTVVWDPEPDKYLVALCSGGQLSNRLICLRRCMLDGALLNRTLVVPARGIDYNYDTMIDLEGVNKCFGKRNVITLQEYEERGKGAIHVNRFVCHQHAYDGDEVCPSIVRRYEQTLGMRFESIQTAPVRTHGPFFKYPTDQFRSLFASPHPVIAFGNMFGVGGGDMHSWTGGPLKMSPQCSGLLPPSPPIQEAGAGFVNAMLGTGFAALQLRRGDFFEHCRDSSSPEDGRACMFPMVQIGRCLAEKLRGAGVTSLFLAHNADGEELRVLREVMEQEGVALPIISVPKLERQIWAAPLLTRGLGDDPFVLSFLEKTICASARVFLGTPGSTFTEDIKSTREWWHMQSSCDGYVCDPDDKPQYLRLWHKEGEGGSG